MTSTFPLVSLESRSAGTRDVAEEERRIAAHYGYSRENFAKRLAGSAKAVLRVSAFFASYGIRTHAPALTLRENMEQIANYRDHEYDILLADTPFTFEIKGRPNLKFAGLSDFPYVDVSVDTVSGYEAKSRKPLAYLTVSGDLRNALILPTHTYSLWRKERKTDHDRGIQDDFYFARKESFVKRRWLIGLCELLQAAAPSEYLRILEDHGYSPDLANSMQV